MSSTGPRSITHGMLAAVAVTAIVVAGAGATLVAEGGTALAPEEVETTQPLSGPNGATTAAVYVNTGTATSVIKWPSTTVYAPTLPVGTPCSNINLPAGYTTSKVILGYGWVSVPHSRDGGYYQYKRCG